MSAFRRIVIVLLENASRDTVLANDYMANTLRPMGVFLSNSHGVTHPSQPNYIALIGGDLLGFNCDDSGWVNWQDHEVTGTLPDSITSVVDLLEAHGRTWKAYAEDFASAMVVRYDPQVPPSSPSFPNEPAPSGDFGLFARRHVPFLSFPNIVNNPERAALIVEASQLDIDLANGTLPDYSFYTPNLVNDGHNDTATNLRADPIDGQNLKNIEAFLKRFLGDDPISKFPPETLIVITFDEAYPVNVSYNIYTVLIGDMLKAGTSCGIPYNHYDLLRTVEDNFQIGTLGRNDATASPYWFVHGS